MKTNISRFFAVAVLAVLGFVLAGCDSYEARKEAYYEKGKSLFEQGDFERARLELKNALQIDNKHAPSWYLLGQLEERERSYPRAYGSYSKAIEIDPAQYDARVNRARLLLASNDIDLAAEDIDAVLAAQPDHADALASRSALKRKQGDHEGAVADAKRAIEIDPANLGGAMILASEYTDTGEIDKAEQILIEAIRLNPGNPAPRLVLGNIYNATKNLKGAIEVLHGLVESKPEVLAFHARLASYLVADGRTDEAEQVLRDALESDPEDVDRQRAYLAFLAEYRGQEVVTRQLTSLQQRFPKSMELLFIESGYQLKQGAVADSKATLRRIIDETHGIGAHAIKARNALAELLIKEQNADQALELIETTLAEAPQDPDALVLRSLIVLGKKDYDQAVVDLRTVVRETPDKAIAWRLLGQAHVARDELVLAEEAFEKAAELAPDDLQSKGALARLKLRRGDTSGAKVDLEAILGKSPDSLGVHVALARINAAEQNWDALSKGAQRLQETMPDSPVGDYLEGVALQRQGQHEAAIEAFERALVLQPKALEPLAALVKSRVALDQVDLAVQRVKQVLENGPAKAATLNLLANLYLAKGDQDKAREIFNRSIEKEPKAAAAYIALARLSAAAGDLDDARSILERGVDASDSNPAVLADLAIIAQQQGDLAAAIENYEALLARRPNHAVAINNLAMLLATEVADAPALERAIKLAQPLKESQQPLFVDTVGWIHYLRGDYEQAAVFLEKANALKQGVAEIEYHLGLNYLKLGKQEQARRYLAAAAANEGYRERGKAEDALRALSGKG